MPLIKCPGCGNDISDRAEKCIHCGYILGSPKTSEINNDNVSINTGVTNNETIGSGPLIASSSSVVDSGPLNSQGASAKTICSNCGAELSADQDFCPKCGQAKAKKRVCSKCGAELQEGQDFCPKCGQKTDVLVNSSVNSAINQFNAGIEKQNQKKKKTPIVIVILVAIIVLGAIAFKKIAPKIFIDTAGYIEKGDYEKAYEKAKTDEDKQMVVDAYLNDGEYKEAYDIALSDQDKLQIQIENAAAVYGQYSADNLKDPSSFVLRDAYYYEGEKDEDGKISKRLVLQISGNNSYGASVSSYWLYTWSYDKNQFSYFCSVSDLSDEDYSKYDDEDETIEKLANNIGRSFIKTTLSDGTKLNKDSVKRINKMFEDDKLDRVELLDELY